MQTLELSQNITLGNGQKISALQLDFESLAVADFRQIKKLEAMISDGASIDATDMTKPKSLSFEFQLASGFLAAIKGTNGLQIGDFVSLSMTDALNISQAAAFFWLGVD